MMDHVQSLIRNHDTSDLVYRYYRRDNKSWIMIGEARNFPFQELNTYHYGFVKIGTNEPESEEWSEEEEEEVNPPSAV